MVKFNPTLPQDIKINQIKEAIDKADKMQSRYAAQTYEVSALTSLKIRHLLNNIGALGKRYLEVGVHKGGTFCATIKGNSNLLSAIAIDSFESDERQEDKAKPIFLANAIEHKPQNTKLILIEGDSFKISFDSFSKPVDIYLYDGGHSEEQQRQALTYYLPVLADEFIYLCDDYDWPEVQKGTQDGIKECGLSILFQKHLVSAKTREEGGHDNDSYYNGFYIALLRKKA